MPTFNLYTADSLEKLRSMPDNSIDSVITDAPYGLGKEPDPVEVMKAWAATGYHEIKGSGFMGKQWDAFVPQPVLWKEVFRVLKPGGYLLSFFGTRTYDWGTMAIRFAGFEIRDCIQWIYGSGFPKSLNISKAIDKEAGAEREIVQTIPDRWAGKGVVLQRSLQSGNDTVNITAPATDAAKQWQGFGTSLKPAVEPICVARKPLEKGLTVAQNVQKWGTGAINIDGCRVETLEKRPLIIPKGDLPSQHCYGEGLHGSYQDPEGTMQGRWPANLVLSDCPEVLAGFPDSKGQLAKVSDAQRSSLNTYGEKSDNGKEYETRNDSGSAARFFYTAKASKRDRNEGLEGFTNVHPTVKNTPLMQWLVRMVTPPGGTVVDPFSGSGSTGKACAKEGFNYIGIDLSAEYTKIAASRIAFVAGDDSVFVDDILQDKYLKSPTDSDQQQYLF